MEQHEHQCLLPELQEDVLADVLRRLAPRRLAVSRCVCKAWRSTIDDRRLLRAELLPHTLGGIFVDFNMLGRAEFFSASGSISGDLGYKSIEDHCNGLLLLFSCVANPATRQWAHLPLQPPPRMVTVTDRPYYYELPYLVFDPTLSHYYEVFLFPVLPLWANLDRKMRQSEWPPALLETHVFSSRTGCWEERLFVREGEPAGTMAKMQRAMPGQKRYGVYWRGALYDINLELQVPSDWTTGGH
nr:unnamed protein product [Digitaria exilis]